MGSDRAGETHEQISEDLFRLFQRGDADAFTEIARRFTPALIAYLRARVEFEAAEEIAQDALMILFENRGRIHGPEKIASWLFTVSQRKAISHHRKRIRNSILLHDRTNDAEERFDTRPSAIDQLAREQWEAYAVKAMAKLNEKEREIVSLRFFAGLKHREIAETMGLDEKSMGIRLQRALNKMAKSLKAMGLTLKDLTDE